MLPQQVVDHILSYAPYLPTRATRTNQCDRLTNILSDSFPDLDRPKQLRRAVVDGDFTKMRMLLNFRTDPNAFVNETIEWAFIANQGGCAWNHGRMVFDEDFPVVCWQELANMGAGEMGFCLAGNVEGARVVSQIPALLGTILAVGWTCPRSLLHQVWWCHLSTTSAHSKAQARRWALWKPILRSI